MTWLNNCNLNEVVILSTPANFIFLTESLLDVYDFERRVEVIQNK